MPWCDACDRFFSPSTVRADGTCPVCGRAVDPGRARPSPAAVADADERGEALPAADDVEGERSEDEDLPPVPWHLKALGAALAIYLGYRAFQGIEWIFGK